VLVEGRRLDPALHLELDRCAGRGAG
jgi:hypothetical protein